MTKKNAEAILAALGSEPTAQVTQVKPSLKMMLRPIAMNSSTLQELAATHFGFPTDKTLRIANNLFDREIISCPETTANSYAPDIQLK